MDKKAALELSINAIVIVVLAMTLLGLGLGFIRGMFGKLTGLSEATFEKISEDLNTNLATSEAPLLFSKTRINLDRGSSTLEAFGVRNDGDAIMKYGIDIETFSCPEGARNGTDCYDINDWFEYFEGPEQYVIKPAERQVNKVQITIGKTLPGTLISSPQGLYLLKLSAYTGNQTKDIFGQTELFLTVS